MKLFCDKRDGFVVEIRFRDNDAFWLRQFIDEFFESFTGESGF